MEKMQKFVSSMARGTQKTLFILNGVLGDTLEKNKTGLALKMALHDTFGPLNLTKKALSHCDLPNTGKICILAHGSCSSEKAWGFKGNKSTNYGSLLQKDFDFTPFFLRYNSGLHISTNGKRLSNLLEKFIQAYPTKINEIILVGHSMGGLLFRSACYYGQKENKKWIGMIKKIFYLGTPHSGTHLEKLGKLTTTILNQIPNPITRMIVTLGDLRSAGIKDLRHGFITDEDWQNKNSDTFFYRHKNKTPLLKDTHHYIICGTLSKVAGSKMGYLFGDGLVHPTSGTGRSLFLKENCKIIPGISHHHLQASKKVYQQIKIWCSSH